jgi:hypothetical protein
MTRKVLGIDDVEVGQQYILKVPTRLMGSTRVRVLGQLIPLRSELEEWLIRAQGAGRELEGKEPIWRSGDCVVTVRGKTTIHSLADWEETAGENYEPAVVLRLATAHSAIVMRLPDAEAAARGLPVGPDYFVRGEVFVRRDERADPLFMGDESYQAWKPAVYIEETEFIVPLAWLRCVDEAYDDGTEWRSDPRQLAKTSSKDPDEAG